MTRNRLLKRTAGGLLLAAAGLLTWALLSVEMVCSEPGCAVPRYRIDVRVDQLQGAEPLPLVAETGEGPRTLAELFAQGGVELQVNPGRRVLPYDVSAGALDEADLASYAQLWSGGGLATAGNDGHVYAMVAPSLRSERGVPLFGVLFDHARREGVAVAPAATRRLFTRYHETQVPLLQMRTFAHELLHALNRYHRDAAQSVDGRLTVEAPTSCISEITRDAWRLREPPLWALSPATIRHFQSAPRAEVIPGADGMPFDSGRVSARDCERARRTIIGPAPGRVELALEKLLGLAVRSARAAEIDASGAAVALRLDLPVAPLPLGFPVMVILEATNQGVQPVPLRGRLMPEYAQIHVQYRAEGEEGWHSFRPLQLLEPIDDPEVMLQPGERIAEAIEIYFGDTGWIFPEPGRYELRVQLGTTSEAGAGGIATGMIEFASPQEPADRAALAPLLDAEGRLDTRIGRFIAMQGRVRDDDAIERLRRAESAAPHTALVAALRLTLAARDLRGPIDPATGRRAVAAPGLARERLQYVCRDSGLAALAAQLAQAAAIGGVTDLQDVVGVRGAEAWEGRRSAPDAGALRFGEASLRLFGELTNFAYGEGGLPAGSRAAIRDILVQLRESGATRVLVAGHSDGLGTCRGNLAAAEMRARAVAAELVRRGWPAAGIDVVSLGANRPRDYSAGAAADERNRRVEIWSREP